MTRDEFVDRLLEKGHTVLDDHVDAIVDAFEVAGLLDNLDDTIDPVELDASVSRLDARMEATGLVRPLGERVAAALGSVMSSLGIKLQASVMERYARDVIRLAGLDANPLDATIPPFLCPRCGADKCHRCGWSGTTRLQSEGEGEHSTFCIHHGTHTLTHDGEAPAPESGEAWGMDDGQRILEASFIAGGGISALKLAAEAQNIAAARQSRELREAREMIQTREDELESVYKERAAARADLATTRTDYAKACADLATAKTECERLRAEINGVLDSIGEVEVVRVREGGGPESLGATLAVNVGRLLRDLASKTAECERLRVDLDIARRITVSSLPAEDLAAARAAGFAEGKAEGEKR